MKINFRQGVVSYQSGGFLQISGNDVNILATNRPVTVSVAQKTSNYTHSEDNAVPSAWVGPFTAFTNYWLYWNFDPLTFVRTFGHTAIEPITQSAVPGAGDASIVGATPSDGSPTSVGTFIVSKFYDLPIGKPFAVNGSTTNDGNYTVKSISYSTGTGKTTIGVNEAVASSTADGAATLDIDSFGNPLLIEGRHWFDTASNIHYVRTLNVWTPVLRVFAARLQSATTFISLSINATSGDFAGTQIGDTSDVFTGRVLFDEAGKPIRRTDGTFFTTEDQFFANQSRVDGLRLESNVVRAQSVATSMAEFSVVAWTGDGQIDVAQYSDVGSTVVGMLTENVSNTEIGGVIVQGTVTNPSWNWTATTTIGAALWVVSGQLVTTDPYISDPLNNLVQYVPVARVLSKDTVIFEQGLGGVGPPGPQGSISGFPAATTSVLGGVTLVTASSDAARAWVISDTDIRLTNARIPLSHTHQATDVTFTPGGGITANNVQTALVEVGSGKLDLTGGTMTGFLTLNANPTTNLQAATKQYVDAAQAGGTLSLLTDVTIATPASGEVLTYNGSIWVNSVIPAGVTTLDGLTDVDVLGSPSAVSGEVLTYNGSIWVNSPLPTGVTTLDGLTDVSVLGSPSVVSGEVLTYNGSEWINSPLPTGVTTLDGLTDVSVLGSPAQLSGDILAYDGSIWVNLPQPYDLAASFFGAVSDADQLMRFVVIRTFVLFAAGHAGYAETAPPTGSPSASSVFDVSLKPIGSPSITATIGTLTFVAGSNTATLSGFTERTLVPGDVLTTTCTTASSIADVSISFLGRVA